MKEHLENQAQQWELDAVNVPFQWAVDMFLFLETRDERLEKGLELLESKVSGQLVDVNARLGGIEARQLELMTIVKDINGKLDKLLSNN
ncbi:uncharacterized protein LOC129582729 isoform X2 [Paramacrobiotus metropolitanus]|nr:uncharacterized protein LOC129582729 isoform X2 [Paramacrobiotus metropolitanus]